MCDDDVTVSPVICHSATGTKLFENHRIPVIESCQILFKNSLISMYFFSELLYFVSFLEKFNEFWHCGFQMGKRHRLREVAFCSIRQNHDPPFFEKRWVSDFVGKLLNWTSAIMILWCKFKLVLLILNFQCSIIRKPGTIFPNSIKICFTSLVIQSTRDLTACCGSGHGVRPTYRPDIKPFWAML